MDEELRKSELLPITVQQAYVLARMCRDDDVAKFYETVQLDEFVAMIGWLIMLTILVLRMKTPDTLAW